MLILKNFKLQVYARIRSFRESLFRPLFNVRDSLFQEMAVLVSEFGKNSLRVLRSAVQLLSVHHARLP